jgi:hypothetical protein
MNDAGVSPVILIKEFAHMGRIMSEQDGQWRRFKISTRFNGIKTRVIKVPITGDPGTVLGTVLGTEKASK